MPEGEFCVVCGATDRPLVDGVCAPCAADRTPLVWSPRQGEVTICPHCGAREVGAHWERAGSSRVLGSEDLVPFLEMHPEVGLRRVRWEETAATPNQRELRGTAHVVFRGVPRDVEVPMTVRIVSKSCPECSRKSGRYYTAIIQLRGGAEDRSERAAELRARLESIWGQLLREARPDSRKALSWTEELPEGWDCYFTETLPARSLARLAKQRYGVAIKESSSLAGRKHGQDVYRVTFCLRFPRGLGPGAASAPEGRTDAVEQ
jgi:nonsense-mediated mRNA decay protein 3